jgi:GTP cyclohydrolase I
MNIHAPTPSQALATISEDEALDAAARLQDWLRQRHGPADSAALDALLGQVGRQLPRAWSRDYPQDFRADAAYRATLPDLQNGPASLIRGARRTIQHVGIAGFRLPIRYRRRDGDPLTLETAVTGTVSLDAGKKGINMSRIMRSFYAHADAAFSFEVIAAALDAYKADLESFDARIQMALSFPVRKASLRSGLEGWQYYDIALEMIDRGGLRTRILHLDYVYSSTCPCSLELAEHARETRGQLATPHSQRSVARLSVELAGDATLWFEDLVDLARKAIPTETQVMVKREDEQAFAELNAANPIFVEDAARLFAQALQADPRIGDFRVAASHQESLHSHDAVSVLTEGSLFDTASVEPHLFGSLIHGR